MELSPIGQIIAQEWQKTEQIRANVEMDEWVIMPNYVHGIVVIEARPGAPFQPSDIGRDAPPVETPHRGVSTIANWN